MCNRVISQNLNKPEGGVGIGASIVQVYPKPKSVENQHIICRRDGKFD